VIDCSTENMGCDGGWMIKANKFLSTDGVVLETDYPYVIEQTACRGSQMQKVFYLEDPGYIEVYPKSYDLKQALR
jgi:hypothetical protein